MQANDAKSAANRVFEKIGRFATRFPVTVIMAYIVMAIAATVYTIKTIELDTDTSKMLSLDLEYRQPFFALNKTFPQLDNLILVVVDAEDAQEGRKTVAEISDAFLARPDMLANVFAPQVGDFFKRHGILYQTPQQVKELVDQISDSEPAIRILRENPNMAGFAELSDNLEVAAQAGIDIAPIATLFNEAADTVRRRIDGAPEAMDWIGLGRRQLEKKPERFYLAVQPKLDFTKPDPFAEPLELVREIVARPEIADRPGIEIALTGEITLNAEELDTVSQGAAVAGLASLVIVTIVIFFGMPAVRLIVPALAMIILGFLMTAGFATLSVGQLNLISVAFAVLFIGLGIDYAVHVILRYVEYSRQGMERPVAVIKAVGHAGPALAVCTVTTSAAFLSFVPTDFVGMGQLGIISAGGILVAMMASVTLVPAVLVLLPFPKKLLNTTVPTPTMPPGAAAETTSRLRFWATCLTLAVCAASVLFWPQVRFDGDPVNLKSDQAPSVVAFKRLLKDQPEQAYAAQLVAVGEAQADDLRSQLLALPEVKSIQTVSDFLPDQQEAKIAQLNRLAEAVPGPSKPLIDIGAIERERSILSTIASLERVNEADIDAGAKAAIQRFLTAMRTFLETDGGNVQTKDLESDLFSTFPTAVLRLIALSQLKTIGLADLDPDIRDRFVSSNGEFRLQIAPAQDLNDELNLMAFADAVRNVSAGATGTPVEIVGAGRTIAGAMLFAVVFSLGLVLVMLLPILRSLSDTILVLMPIALAGSLLAAYTVIAGTPFNFANVIVMPLLLGLGIDASVHYVMRAREGHGGAGVGQTSTPRAILIAALTTIGSFGTLWTSAHNGTSSMGELLTVAILFNLLTTLVVLPQLLIWKTRLFGAGKP